MQAAERPLPVGSAGGPKSPPERTRVTLTNSRAAGRFLAGNKSRTGEHRLHRATIEREAASRRFHHRRLACRPRFLDGCTTMPGAKSQGARRSRFPAARDARGRGQSRTRNARDQRPSSLLGPGRMAGKKIRLRVRKRTEAPPLVRHIRSRRVRGLSATAPEHGGSLGLVLRFYSPTSGPVVPGRKSDCCDSSFTWKDKNL